MSDSFFQIKALLKKWDTEKIEGLLQRFITSSGYSSPSRNGVCLQLDLVEHLIHVLRIKNRHLINAVAFENFIQGMVFPDTTQLHVIAGENPVNLGCGTAPMSLQPKLLLFLLLYHRDRFQIYAIIEQFVQRIWNELEPVDFKQTQTGVTRCFTNTRFAANKLREYGFLRYTREEAFKTWVLSLPGFIVASKVLEERNWSIGRPSREANFDLHPTIRGAWAGLETFDAMVNRLRSLCEPNVDVFDTFKEYLRFAHTLLSRYWEVLSNPEITQQDRMTSSKDFICQLDDDLRTKPFCEELSASVKIDDFLRNTLEA
jgi:hypothetical protein